MSSKPGVMASPGGAPAPYSAVHMSHGVSHGVPMPLPSGSMPPGSSSMGGGAGSGVLMGANGPMAKDASGVFSPLQSPLSSPRINYPPVMGMTPVSAGMAMGMGLVAGMGMGMGMGMGGGGGKQLPPLNHPAQPQANSSSVGGTGTGASLSTGSSGPSFTGTFPGQQPTGGASNLYPSTGGLTSGSNMLPLPGGGGPVSAQQSSSSSTSTYEQEVERMGVYARTKLDSVMKEMLMSVFANSPIDPVAFMISFLQDYQKKHPAEPPNQLPFLGVPGGPKTNRSRRSAVSAEPLLRVSTKERPNTIIPKSEPEKARIRQSIKQNILFNALNGEQIDICLDAMEFKEFKAGDSIITQGDDGEHFFVVDSGDCECYVSSQDKPKPRLVRKYTAGDTFGELALMYGCPRTATIKAKTNVAVWAMDRLTFHRVLMETTAQRREKYEKFLAQVPLFAGLDRYERARIADSLDEASFEDQEFIIEQGDEKDNATFYILAEGEAKAVKTFGESDKPLEVMRYKPGDYFGELVLMAQPTGAGAKLPARSATVIALGQVKVLTLDRGVFVRLLGPLQEVLKRTRASYETIEKELEAYVRDGKANIAPPVYYQKRRRTGVSAEPSSETSKAQDLRVKPAVIPKTPQQLANIKRAISANFLFQSLDDDTLRKVLDAMFEIKFAPGDLIIEQGKDGDYFYVVDSGVCECWMRPNQHAQPLPAGSDANAAAAAAAAAAHAAAAQPKMVAVYEHGDSFGELALMYNTPRAATIKARTSVSVWAMDRLTFRYHIMEQTSKKRKRYEDFLASVPLLASLDRYERSKIADCLTSQSYSDGALIIRQGDAGDTFYLLEEGKAKATKAVQPTPGGRGGGGGNGGGGGGAAQGKATEVDVYHYDVGSYFGELALLTAQPRAANVVAVGPCRCVCIDRASFTRLLGPMQDILRRNQANYRDIEKRLGITL